MQIRQWIERTPDLTLSRLSERLAEEGIQIKIPALWHQLDKWRLSFKKTLHASEQSRSDVALARSEWIMSSHTGIADTWCFLMKRPRPPT